MRIITTIFALPLGFYCGVSGMEAALKPNPATAPRVGKPNIVHIMLDDLGWQDIASHRIDGSPVYETPHLDRLTKMGRRFTQAYSPATVCAPSRVSFLRGQYPFRAGTYSVGGGQIPRAFNQSRQRICPYFRHGLAPEEPTVADILKKAGYMTGHVGKWHAGGKGESYPFPVDQGFTFGFTENNRGQAYYNDEELWNPAEKNRNRLAGVLERMRPHRLTGFATSGPDDPFQLNEEGRPFDKPLDLALGFIRKHKDKPFFLNYCTFLVHFPIQTRNRERLEYYSRKMGCEFPTDPDATYPIADGQLNPYYAAMVDEVDWMVGQIVRYLETTDDPRNPGHKLIDNTYIVLDSDNGGVERFTSNAPLTGGKQRSFEGGIRIPFIVRGPKVPAGTVCETPINLIDLFPTFMAMAQLKPDSSLALDGCNILPLMLGDDGPATFADGTERQALFWYSPLDVHMAAAIRKGDWKLIRNYGSGVGVDPNPSVKLFRLYDNGVANDLSEENDLSRQYPELTEQLLAELDGELKAAETPLPYRNPDSPRMDRKETAMMPRVLGRGFDDDVVWVNVESGAGKSEIVDAQLLYTLNPKPSDTRGGNREEWFATHANIEQGRITARMPPGATHAAFCLRDENNFLITSEPLHLPLAKGGHR